MGEQEYLRRRDPQGYYILLFDAKILDKLRGFKDIIVEEAGDTIIVKVKSRALAKKLIIRFKDYVMKP